MGPTQFDNTVPAPGSRRTVARKIRSFVKRESRMSKRQKAAFDKLFPVYGLRVEQGLLDLGALFTRQAPTILEIGFGMGHSLALMAQQNPANNYLGIEVHRPGVGSLLATLEEQGIDNVRIFCHDATEIMAHCIADNTLTGIQIFFPDPWPKERHHKRRLIQPDFAAALVRKIQSHGTLHVATDWEHYAHWIDLIMAGQPQLLKLPDDTVHHRPVTKFEQRGLDLGHKVWDLMYRKTT